jgi:two-component system, cell cycle response regulator
VTRRTLRRAVRVGGGAVVAAAACGSIAAGVLDHASIAPAAVTVVFVASVLALTVYSVSARVTFTEPSPRAQRVSRLLRAAPVLADLQLGLAFVAGAYTVIGLSELAYPLLYGVVAFSVMFQPRVASAFVVCTAIAIELSFVLRADDGAVGPATLRAAAQICFITGAAVAHVVFVRGLVWRLRHQHRARLDQELRQLREEARDYRLISAALGPDSRAPRSREVEEQKLAAGAVESLRSSVFYTLRLIKRSLGARTCALLWLDERSESLRIKELISDSDAVTESRVIPLNGALRAIARDRGPLALPAVKAAQLPYYEPHEHVGAFVGVPFLDGLHVRGILCADRERPFDEGDAALLQGATEQILRAIQSEQVFTAVERAKYELERFYRASDMLCRTLTLEQVIDTAFDAIEQIVDTDVAVIALYDRHRRRHRVQKVRIKQGCENLVAVDQLSGLEFRDNAGLASMVVKNKHYLPAAGGARDLSAPIFTKGVRMRSIGSLLVLPLLCADEAIGTLTLISRGTNRFGKDVREMLGIIANQVAVCLQNAGMYKHMETMATTDGLTGLTNHRTFQERAGDLLERAGRHGHRAAVLLTDVDHFKRVNDTYGHPVGDEVLRRVARVLAEAVRKIDIVARYGGEEFAVVLEATDLAGAVKLAERIRQDVARLVIESEQGPFQVTLSCGVAAFPDDATDRETLIERADHALYHAKESGRNRVVSYREFVLVQNARKAG